MADIAIVGAGVSGLYTAYRLIQRWCDAYAASPCSTRCRPPSIVMIEQQAQVGGRIKSAALLPTAPSPLFKADLCAMRYYASVQPAIAQLVAELSAAGQATLLQTSIVPAASAPLVTPQYPLIDLSVQTLYPPGTDAATNVSFSAAIAISTADATQATLLAQSLGYPFFDQGAALSVYYAEPPLDGVDETRFVNGFDALCQALLARIQALYAQSYDLLVQNNAIEGNVTCKAHMNKYFCLYLNAKVDGLVQRHTACAARIVPAPPTSWFSWGTPAPDLLASGTIEAQEKRAADGGNMVRVFFSANGRSCYFYDVGQVVLTGTPAQTDALNCGAYVWDENEAFTASAAASSTSEAPVSNVREKTAPAPYDHSKLSLRNKKQAAMHTEDSGGLIPSAPMQQLNDRRNAAARHLRVYGGVKFFVHYTQPWWTPNVFTKFCADPLLSQIVYFSPNVLEVYTIGEQAETLLDMFAQNFATTPRSVLLHTQTDRWLPAAAVSFLLSYVNSHLATIIGAAVTPQPLPSPTQLASADQVLFHYAPEALACDAPQVNRATVLQTHDFLQSGQRTGLWWLAGDVGVGPSGWVNTALINIDGRLSQIEALL